MSNLDAHYIPMVPEIAVGREPKNDLKGSLALCWKFLPSSPNHDLLCTSCLYVFRFMHAINEMLLSTILTSQMFT